MVDPKKKYTRNYFYGELDVEQLLVRSFFLYPIVLKNLKKYFGAFESL